jgi:hypothetical protein
VRAIQRTQFRAKNVKNDLNPRDLVKCNFCFETEGVIPTENPRKLEKEQRKKSCNENTHVFVRIRIVT